jgi:hypothetical protein
MLGFQSDGIGGKFIMDLAVGTPILFLCLNPELNSGLLQEMP